MGKDRPYTKGGSPSQDVQCPLVLHHHLCHHERLLWHCHVDRAPRLYQPAPSKRSTLHLAARSHQETSSLALHQRTPSQACSVWRPSLQTHPFICYPHAYSHQEAARPRTMGHTNRPPHREGRGRGLEYGSSKRVPQAHVTGPSPKHARRSHFTAQLLSHL